MNGTSSESPLYGNGTTSLYPEIMVSYMKMYEEKKRVTLCVETDTGLIKEDVILLEHYLILFCKHEKD